MLTVDRTKVLEDFMRESFKTYVERNQGQQPGLLIYTETESVVQPFRRKF